ncbi:MAG: NADPH-dependent F420 reductase [Archaeoglobaceae archaeon]|nr:NADPH-dependent F420 reductase [Archaeoglobaceae archaeon]MCX8152048.1 NADPH-dependent F420 reductase [Archaeoglobaceae archaeon]MDW8013813.1 NADPH-dependent F420 reductase [Archaeoglobaceae archaeon]
MRIALLGGTGNLGEGLAVRLAKIGYKVIVGSRLEEKAKRIAAEYSKIAEAEIVGMTNKDAAKNCEVAFFTIPWKYAFEIAETLKDELRDKILVSPIVPMKKEGEIFQYVQLPEGSAAEKIASITEGKVVAAFHSIPAERFANLNEKIDWDLLVCGDQEAKKVLTEIAEKMGFRVLDVGPLNVARQLESLTPLILNIIIRNKNKVKKELTIKFI